MKRMHINICNWYDFVSYWYELVLSWYEFVLCCYEFDSIWYVSYKT